MGYALKLGSVDFSSVAVGQVTLVDPVPCTALSLDQSTLSFDSAEETKTLTATKTPSDTTDTLTWASSNTNVATVENGVVTIHGIGTATITATCGEQTATATISQTTIKAQYNIYKPENSAFGKDTFTEGDIISVTTTSGQRAIGQAYTNSDELRVNIGANSSALANTIELVKVPYGATKAKISTSDGIAVSINYSYIVDVTDLVTRNNKKYPKFVSQTTFVNTSTGLTVQYGQAVGFRALEASTATLDYIYFTAS